MFARAYETAWNSTWRHGPLKHKGADGQTGEVSAQYQPTRWGKARWGLEVPFFPTILSFFISLKMIFWPLNIFHLYACISSSAYVKILMQQDKLIICFRREKPGRHFYYPLWDLSEKILEGEEDRKNTVRHFSPDLCSHEGEGHFPVK